MPNMDGYRFCNEVRRQERLQHLPFIIYSSTYNSPTDAQLALDMGADKYIKKPAPIKEITDALAEIIRRGPRCRPAPLPPQKELNLAKVYNETLVNKLKQTNEELIGQTEALRASEEKFRQLAENINEVFWIASADQSETLYISPAYEKTWGRTCRSVYENPRSFLEGIHEADRPRVLAALAELKQGGKYDLEFRVVRPDGQIRWVHDRGTAIRNESGAIYRLAGIAEDITQRKEIEQQFRQAQKMESIGQLAGGVAHDFNNLLAIIGGNLELFLMTAKNIDPKAMEYLSHIAHAADRAAALNRQLLTFSRSEAVQMQPLDLNELTASFTKMLRRIVGEHIAMRTDFASTTPQIKADPGMIEQVLMNLAVNARDAMPNGGQIIIRTEVAVIDAAHAKLDSRVHAGRFACLSVRDTGTGISPENMARIFEPFFTTKGVGKGTGLGLATVFGIAKQHNGWIDVSSEVGVGTVFRVYLPINSDDFVAPNPAAGQKLRGGAEKILVVEDDPNVREVVLLLLEHQGYAVRVADSAISAQKIWSEQGGQFDLLLTDMVMPGGLNGLELGALLRAQKPGLKLILCSGYSEELADAGVVEEKDFTFLHKPFSGRVLAETVRKCLDAP
jgi:PAS domain S-box-containing protein